jgi:hypothetical protein
METCLPSALDRGAPSGRRAPARPRPAAPRPSLAQAFDASGGVLAADALAQLMQGAVAQPISRLARWIVAREIVTVPGDGGTLVPLFQFGPGLASPQPGLLPVLAELRDVFDDRELAAWFAAPNGSLGGRRPADVLATDPHAVHETARLDRYVARGG